MALPLLTWVSTIKAILVNDSLKKTNGSLYSLFFHVAKKKPWPRQLVGERVYLGLQLQKVKVHSDREAAVITVGVEAKGPNFKTQTGSKESKL